MAGQRKAAYIVDVLRQAQALVEVADQLADLDNEYFDNGYNSGGANEIVDANMAVHDMTAAQFASLVTVMQQVDKLLTNQATTTGDYILNLNAARRASGV